VPLRCAVARDSGPQGPAGAGNGHFEPAGVFLMQSPGARPVLRARAEPALCLKTQLLGYSAQSHLSINTAGWPCPISGEHVAPKEF
jgi:hypothetical protein